MSNTDCKRCGGEGIISQYLNHQGGICFACGHRRARGTAGGKECGWTRAAVIHQLHTWIRIARALPATGDEWTRADWLAEVCDADGAPALPPILAIADADVRARALAALEPLFPAGLLVATLAAYRGRADAATAAFLAEMARRAAIVPSNGDEIFAEFAA